MRYGQAGWGAGVMRGNRPDLIWVLTVVVVLLTILAAPLLLWDDSDTIPAAYHSSLAAVSSDDTAASAEAVADAVAGGFFEFFSASERKPVALAFAGNVWWWTDTYPRSPRSTDRLVLSSGDCGAEASFFEKRFSSRDASASSNASSEEARAPLAPAEAGAPRRAPGEGGRAVRGKREDASAAARAARELQRRDATQPGREAEHRVPPRAPRVW